MQYGLFPSRFSAFSDKLLREFVLLSLMLHILLIVLFGDATGGGARRGEKLWGALTVTVQGMLQNRDDGPGLKIDRGATSIPRPEVDVRSAPVSPEPSVPARETREPVQAEEFRPAEAEVLPAPAQPVEMPSLIAKDVDKAVTDFVVSKPSVDRALVPTIQAPPIEQAPRETPAVVAPVVPTPVVIAPAPEPLAPIKIAPLLTAPLVPLKQMEIKPRAEPPAPPILQPEPPRPSVEREVIKPVIVAPEVKPRDTVQPALPTTAPMPPAPTITVPPIAPPVAAPVAPAPREIPAAPAPALNEPAQRAEVAKPPKIESEAATSAASPAPPKAVPSRQPIGAPSGTPTGTPNSDNDLFKPRGDAATSATGKSPSIDLDAVRRRARELSGDGAGRSVFPFPVAPPPKPKSKEQQAFDKALKKNDCRDAYAGLGLAAVVPLVIDAVRDDGCKW
jgi:hypothetical protein